jgi:hypothetical protein
MRALTVRPPWSWAIAHGGKNIENRSWPTSYRGLLAIHGGARSRWDPDGQASPLLRAAWAEHARSRPEAHNTIWLLRKSTEWMAFGAVVAVAELRGCHGPDDCPATCSPWAAWGQYHWNLFDARALPEPVPCRGALGLWRLPEDVEKAVREQLEARDVTATPRREIGREK